jgi:adenylate kinase
MVSAGDHGHSGRQVPDHVVGRLAHPVLVVVERKVLLDELLARRHRDLDRALDDRRSHVLECDQGPML